MGKSRYTCITVRVCGAGGGARQSMYVVTGLLTAHVDAFVVQMAAKYDLEQEQQARVWMEEVTGKPIDAVNAIS